MGHAIVSALRPAVKKVKKFVKKVAKPIVRWYKEQKVQHRKHQQLIKSGLIVDADKYFAKRSYNPPREIALIEDTEGELAISSLFVGPLYSGAKALIGMIGRRAASGSARSAGAAMAASASQLETRANQVHGILDPIAQRSEPPPP